MKNKKLCVSVCLLMAFAVWTLLVSFIDMGPIAPSGELVGFSTVNEYFHNLTGTNMWLYTLTDWLSLIPLLICVSFGALGLFQLISRRSLWKVDHDIIALGVFYIVVMSTFALFEVAVVNYRTVLIDGRLEASYPSSTTMLVMTVMSTAAMQMNARIRNKTFRICVVAACLAFGAFMVVGRIISGVHWITDIIGGAIFSAGVVLLYYSVCKMLKGSKI